MHSDENPGEDTTNAMQILRREAEDSSREDYTPGPDVNAALDYLASLPVRKDLINRFRRKLNNHHALARKACVLAAYEALERELNRIVPSEAEM